MNVSFAPKSFVTLGAVLLGLVAPVLAQSDSPTISATIKALQESSSPERITLNYVRPSAVEAWLRAAQTSQENGSSAMYLAPTGNFSAARMLPRQPGNGLGPLDLKWPQGVDSIVAIDPQNALLVRGTPEGLKALRETLAKVDVPLVQYEVETRFIQMSRRKLAGAGIKFDNANTPNSPLSNYGSVAPISLDDLRRLSKQQIPLSAPRVLVVDGIEASVQHQSTTPFVVDTQLVKDSLGTQKERSFPQGVNDIPAGTAMLSSAIGVNTLVLQRPDHLVTVWITPSYGNRSLTVATTLKEDASFAIQMSPPTDAQQLVAIVTPRRVRRASE